MFYRMTRQSYTREILLLSDYRGQLHVAKVVAGAVNEGLDFIGNEPGEGVLVLQHSEPSARCLVALTLIDCPADFAEAFIKAVV